MKNLVKLIHFLAHLLVVVAKFKCQKLVTPRVFGGNYEPSEFLSVAIDHQGNMLAGGYTQDETIFVQKLRDFDGEQSIVPIIA